MQSNNPAGAPGQPPTGNGARGLPGLAPSQAAAAAQAPLSSLLGGAVGGRPPQQTTFGAGVHFGASAAAPGLLSGGPKPFARPGAGAIGGAQAHGSPSLAGLAGGGAPKGRPLPMAAQQQVQAPQPAQGLARLPNGPRAGLPVAAPGGGGGPPIPPGGGGGGMRELRVEDALLYLDDVKRAFDDRPEVYNEFLSIMKNFKSQEVDTPGVIARVSRLFHGYNNLILGFNKFLPDGYKISVEDLERMNRANSAQKQAESAAAAAAAAEAQARQQAQAQLQQQQQQLQQQQQQQRQGLQHPSPQAQPKAPPMQLQAQRQQQQLVESNRPPLLQQQTSGPVGAPAQAARQPAAPRSATGGGRGRGRGGRGRLPTHGSAGRGAQDMQRQPQAQVPPGAQARVGEPAAGRPQEAPPRAQQPGAQAAAQAQQPPPVEFDHAISYVTTIKRRFADDPKTYHSFLEILHTYQKEQRGIKQVLEEVARLFADHPDLLKEFTFFLPDAVQEQAKERLHRAAAESEARQAAEQAKRMGQAAQQEKMRGQRAPANDPKVIMDLSEGQAPDDGEAANRGTKRPYGTTVKGAPIAPLAVPQPETAVYNSAVERQFFDSAREALTSFSRDGGQAWAEFLKCLDLYAQEILSRTEMMHIVEPLLGKRNAKLFEEFKRILAAAGSQTGQPPSLEDAWYSVPLSEIDFSRCRRCSPSYRALPRDYPAPPCSDRSEEEKKVLNDVWVSLPVGSEESYTFRHMRRNTYEEILFRCEDERFEIDMVIDSNATTLRRLEPIAKEIAQLSRDEPMTQDLYPGNKPSGRGGLGGRRFRYSFDKNILGVIHRNSIDRIYGDAGQEMLELMVKNPTVAIPVVVKRLRQKNSEWLVVRERLNHHWKDLAKINYYRSLDHRSLTWRTTDKRGTSTRTLVAEIKDRAANGGKEGDAAIQAKLEKAKEEHGTFYEVTMGESLSRQLDLTNLPKPDRRIFTPHLSLMFENNTWAQRDAYRILSFALERGSISPSDKERCHRLWIDFLGPWFGLSLNWMQKPAMGIQDETTTATGPPAVVTKNSGSDDVQMAEGGRGEDDSMEEDTESHPPRTVVTEEPRKETPAAATNASTSAILDHHPLPAGSHVSTVYGEGRVSCFRRSDNTYVVDLPFGAKAYLHPSAVLCSVMTVEKSDYTTQLRAEDRTKMDRPTDMLSIGTQSLYLFFRLHQILIRRLNIAKRVAYSIADDMTLCTLVEQMEGDDKESLGRRRYEAFLSLVYALLDGGTGMSSHGGSSAAEGTKYEDRVRCLLGHGGYELATMDKLISHLLKNLQAMGNDETMWNLVELFRRHADDGIIKPESFRQEAAYLSEGEPVFAFQYSHLSKEDKAVLHFEYLGVISEEEVSHVEESQPVKRQKR
ncbi:amphipathic helix protein Sin3-like [Seminavis robusta]|uniref:Amphipathic helix protein Sin3-like n=1 Tax=Seminavis robusta TaxID=568900 RepID=A0A9N8HK02_9STRA|nr:amphipathic helix protein Sin3-like [Seminavis robusta]|eukprot:Sro902_g218120.1 amphipathic helix protein Sin3-like (1384) ;mRNA; f:5760-9911